MTNVRSWISVILLIVASLILKLIEIGTNDLAHDEPFTVLQAHRSIAGLFKILPEENNPPLHFLFMHFWVKLVPLEAGWLRLPSAIFSALLVWPLFRIGKHLENFRVALIASLLFLFSNYHLGFAHEVRAYSLFALLATVSIWQLLRVINGRSIFLLALVNVLMIYTHFFGWLMIGIQLLCVLLLKEWRKDFRQFLKVLLICGIAYLPYAYIFIARVSTSIGEGTWLDPPSIEEPYNMIWRWSNAPVAAAILIVVILIHLIRSKAAELLTRLSLIWTFVPLSGMFLISFFIPMYLDRYLIYASPGFFLLSAMALNSILPNVRWNWLPPAIVIMIMIFTFHLRNVSWPQPSEVVRSVEDLKPSEQTPIFIHPWWYAHSYAWHLDKELLTDPDRLIENLEQRSIHPIHDTGEIDDKLLPGMQMIVVVAGAEEERRFSEYLSAGTVTSIKSIQPDLHVRVHLLER
ncbi:MAG: glycosyltransferase family 39 protein [Bacteroidota bacterium]|nr:glycosyltransferase family 39 protein [Bacteroidota bacterium]